MGLYRTRGLRPAHYHNRKFGSPESGVVQSLVRGFTITSVGPESGIVECGVRRPRPLLVLILVSGVRSYRTRRPGCNDPGIRSYRMRGTESGMCTRTRNDPLGWWSRASHSRPPYYAVAHYVIHPRAPVRVYVSAIDPGHHLAPGARSGFPG